jgi:transposase-like protein
MNYSDGFKARMVRRMAGPEGISATALAQEVGITQPTLSRWLRDARSVGSMSNRQSNDGQSKRRKTWSTDEKLRVLVEAAQLSDEELGAYLRREGVREATLLEWRQAAAAGLASASTPRRSKKNPEAKKVAALERELHRKEKALAEMAALITLQKKVRAIWGDGDDDTNTKSAT